MPILTQQREYKHGESQGQAIDSAGSKRQRLDGFASITAPMDGGELVTKPIRFTGKHLEINFSTSAAGSVRVEVQDENGVPFESFTLDDSADIYGDSINQVVSCGDSADLSGLAGQPIRLRFMLRDADLYSFQFRQ